jgi:putative flippase GtrA
MNNKVEIFSRLNLFLRESLNEMENIQQQFFRYLIVGTSAFLVDFISLFVFTDILGFYYLFSASTSFILGLILNYYLSVNWVFNKRNLSNKWIEFQIFAVIGILGLFFNGFLLWIFTEYIGIYYLYSKIITAILILIWNFTARKFILFN